MNGWLRELINGQMHVVKDVKAIISTHSLVSEGAFRYRKYRQQCIVMYIYDSYIHYQQYYVHLGKDRPFDPGS